MRKLLVCAPAAAALAIASLSFTTSASAHHVSIIGGACQLTAAPFTPIPLANNHCQALIGQGPSNQGQSNQEQSKKKAKKSKRATGKIVVGCVMSSALGLITASAVKGNAYGYPTRWHSAKEAEEMAKTRNKEADLTSSEAAFIGFSCGAGAPAVIAKYSRPEGTTLFAQFGRPAPRTAVAQTRQSTPRTAVAQVRQPAPRKSVAQVRRPAPRDAVSRSKRPTRKTVIARNNQVFPLNLFGINRIITR